uniref:branched-chain amino acid ABC transporter permease n=1 Tax=Phaeobacter sp. PT47_59 TaxID=3029979 RepID=UPI002380479A|nr:branched-chain amino acid ABC transporter permease [Phaeobacter sp. PT47_59]
MKLMLGALLLAAALGLPPFLGAAWQNALNTMLIASLYALAFNLLAGQAGLLSFGHAAYFGVGSFAVLHLMLATEDGLAFPTPLLPLAGAAAGLVAGLVAGWFSTMRSGVYFALVTLAIAELFHSFAPHLKELFGGESGISGMRMPWGDVMFGTVLEVYYLTLAWVLVCGLLLWGYTRTPFGRLTLAIRDNEQRVRFMGYDAHLAKTVIFAVSAMFTGVAGALQAVSNETANYAVFGAHVSSQVVLFTYVGGATLFLGPVFGAVAFSLFAFLVSDLTRSWLFYQGLIFVLVMLYAPTGIGGAVTQWLHQPRARIRAQLAGPALWVAFGGLGITCGVVFLTEAVSVLFGLDYANLKRGAETLPDFALMGLNWAPLSPLTWGLPLGILAGGIFALRRGVRRLADTEPTSDTNATKEGLTA